MREMSISDVLARESITLVTEGTKNTTNYPLFYSYKDKYNYKNIRESMDRWRNYSPILEKCTDKLLELFEIVNEKGSITQIEEATKIVTSNLSTLKETNEVKSQLRLIENTESILEALDDIALCENIINTHKDISKRFNISEYVQSNAHDIQSCIYGICEFIDTYNIGINTKYKICINETQYLFSKNNVDCSINSIVENVTDYFLFNHMKEEDWNREILHIMEEAINEDRFIHTTDYLELLKKNSIELDEIHESAFSDFEIKPKLLLEEKKNPLAEFKASPVKTISSLKKAIMETFMNIHREEDVIDECPNILAISFYSFVLSGAIAISFWASLAAFIAIIMISHNLTRKSTDKALKIWYKKKIEAQKKLDKETDPEKKKRLEGYIKGLDAGIEKLENHKDAFKSDEEDYAADSRPDELKDKDTEFDFTAESTEANLDEYDYMLFDEDVEVLNELSLGNSITLAMDKVKAAVSKLDVTQQVASRTLDSICARVERAVKKSLTLDSRQAVVRGDILPSMSKCLKLALIGGFLWAINPLLAIAGTAATMILRDDEMRKERQKFVDELDVELTMVDKYIHQAEEKNDLKRVRELLLIKKKLQAHYGKLKYRMKVNYNDHNFELDDARKSM